MNYINFKSKWLQEITLSEYIILIAVNQTETDWLIENLDEDTYKSFEALSLIKHVKAKTKKEHLYTSLRLSDLGKQLLAELEEAPVEPEDKTVFEWLKNHYIKLGKDVGNGAKTQRHIRDFRLKSGIQ